MLVTVITFQNFLTFDKILSPWPNALLDVLAAFSCLLRYNPPIYPFIETDNFSTDSPSLLRKKKF